MVVFTPYPEEEKCGKEGMMWNCDLLEYLSQVRFISETSCDVAG